MKTSIKIVLLLSIMSLLNSCGWLHDQIKEDVNDAMYNYCNVKINKYEAKHPTAKDVVNID